VKKWYRYNFTDSILFYAEKEIKLYAGLGPCYSYLEVKEDISKIDTINIVYASIHENL